MATADSVKAKIQSLISKANSKTGRTDTDMTTAVNALISGYGQGGANEPTGSINITSNGTYDVKNYASAIVNVPTPTEYTVVRTVTVSSDITNTAKTLLTADPFIAEHYADNGFSIFMIPTAQFAAEAKVVHSVYHTNSNIGSNGVIRYGWTYYSSSASAISVGHISAKLSGNGYNTSLRAKSTGNLDIYASSSYIVKAGTYKLVMTCTD